MNVGWRNKAASSPAPNQLVPFALLLLLALVSCTVYLVSFTYSMPLLSFYDTPHMDAPKILGVTEEAMARFLGTAALLWMLYLAAFKVAGRLRPGRSMVVVLILTGLLNLAAIPMYPGGAGDLFAYVAEADLVLKHHASPFDTPVSAFPADALVPYVDFPNETTHYGPLWLAIGVTLRILSGSDLLTTVLVFKAAAAAFLLATAWLVYLTLRRDHPRLAVQGALLVAWNPLLVYELAGNGHNDVAMMLLVALAFYFQARKSPRLAVAALLAAILIKYVAVVLLPLFLLRDLRQAGWWRDWLPRAVLYALVVAAGAGLLVATVGLGGTVGVLQKQSRWFTTSLQSVASLWLSERTSDAEAEGLAGLVGQAAFTFYYLFRLLRSWRRPDGLASSSLAAIMAFMVLVVAWFQPWYVAWAIPIAALAATPTAFAAALGLTLGGFGVHAIMGFAWRLDLNQGSDLAINMAGALAVWLPTAVAAVLASLRYFRRVDPSARSSL